MMTEDNFGYFYLIIAKNKLQIVVYLRKES